MSVIIALSSHVRHVCRIYFYKRPPGEDSNDFNALLVLLWPHVFDQGVLTLFDFSAFYCNILSSLWQV